MNHILKPIFIFSLAVAVTGCGRNKTAAGTAICSGLADRMAASVEAGMILYGHQDDLVYGHTWHVSPDSAATDDLTRSDVHAVAGDYPAVVGFELGGLELGWEASIDKVPFELIRRASVEHVRRGGIVTYSWHPHNPYTGGNAWDVSSDKAVASILERGEHAAMFQQWLVRLGDFFDSLRDENGNLIPVIFRPWHENIGSWFWWGGKLCSAEEYIALFRTTASYLRNDRVLDNILFCYSPNSQIDSALYMSRYPGDDLVDMLGLDHYEFVEGGESLHDAGLRYGALLAEGLDMVRDLAAEHGKLMSLSETGMEGIPDDKWWTSVLYPVIRNYPIVYVLTWRNAWDQETHYYAPFPGREGDFIEFVSEPGVGLLQDLNRI
ncbi:MAG: glycoside hydrolase family 26 protein [Bacteroidota bacterium]|nr:glycoside hydrolase family 26 protein [Bacteroidota bacterium]